MKKLETMVVFTTFIFLILTLIRNLDLQKMWVFADLYPFPSDIKQRVNETFYLWSGEGLGGLVSPMTNIIRFALFTQLFLPYIIAQKVVIFLPFIIGFLSFYFFMRCMNLSIIASYCASLIFIINPTTLSLFLVGETGSLMVLAIFPLFIIILDRWLFSEINGWKYLAAMSVLSFLFFWNLYYAFWLGIFSVLFLICMNLSKKCNFKRVILALPKLILLLAIISLINLPSFVNLLITNEEISAIDLVKQTTYSYEDATILNLMRLAGNKGSPQVSGYLNYNTFNDFTFFGIVLTLIMSLSLLVKNGRDNQILAYSACLSFLLVTSFIILIKFAPYLTESLPLFSTLRNPSKLMLPLVFFFCIMFSISIEGFIRKNGLTLIAIPLIVIVLFLYCYPFLDGTLGVSKMRGSVYIPYNYEIDERYIQLKHFLSSSDMRFNDFYLLYLPWERFSKNTICRIFPNYFGSGSPTVSFALKNIGKIYEALAANPINKAELLSIFNIKYVVIDKTFQSMFTFIEKSGNIHVICDNLNFYWITGPPHVFYDIFASDRNFELIYQDTNFWVFNNKLLDAPRLVYASKVETSNKYVEIITRKENLVSTSFENDLDNFTAIGSYGFINDSIDGSFSVYLQSTGISWPHIYKILPIARVNGSYELSFKVKAFNITNLHAKVLWYDFFPESYEGDYGALRADYIKIYEKNIPEGEWHYVNQTLIPPINARAATIVILGSQAVSKTKFFATTLTLIDDVQFHFRSIESSLDISIVQSKTFVKYDIVNPTLIRVKVSTNNPILLVFNKLYDSKWVAYVNNVQTSRSILSYGLVNGFWINQTGLLEITIEYEPQKWFYIGSIISASTIIVCATYLIYDWAKKKAILERIKKLKPKTFIRRTRNN
ncbi:MAG: hypothetical protein QXO15_10160 [Nitrososphaerota archaeon]